MKISVLCTDSTHPVVNHLKVWMNEISSKGHFSTLVFDKTNLKGGDVLFLVSCSQIIQNTEKDKYKATLVLHASDLPEGRGWSPHIWSILSGSKQITVSLLEASETIDTGAIWLKKTFYLEGYELLPEINEKLFSTELSLMTGAIEKIETIKPLQQTGDPGPYMKKRLPIDSQLDPYKTLAEQFDLLRVVDSERYPAFFDYLGNRYLVKIERVENE